MCVFSLVSWWFQAFTMVRTLEIMPLASLIKKLDLEGMWRVVNQNNDSTHAKITCDNADLSTLEIVATAVGASHPH